MKRFVEFSVFERRCFRCGRILLDGRVGVGFGGLNHCLLSFPLECPVSVLAVLVDTKVTIGSFLVVVPVFLGRGTVFFSDELCQGIGDESGTCDGQ